MLTNPLPSQIVPSRAKKQSPEMNEFQIGAQPVPAESQLTDPGYRPRALFGLPTSGNEGSLDLLSFRVSISSFRTHPTLR